MPAEDVSESVISQFLDTAGMADPDLLIRTGGEMRVSNFLLWQISYSEIWVTTKRWPEFTKNDFFDAMTEYASRQRRFGGIVAKNSDICQETTTGQERESC
jgi:undecaprenyl diphosphate synthase